MNQTPATHPDSGGCLPLPSKNFSPQPIASATSIWTSWPVFRLTRITVHSAAWTAAKPLTSHRAALGSLAREASHAASRRMDSLRFARKEADKIDAVDMALCVARFSHLWNQLGVKKAP